MKAMVNMMATIMMVRERTKRMMMIMMVKSSTRRKMRSKRT